MGPELLCILFAFAMAALEGARWHTLQSITSDIPSQVNTAR
jgi:hypothetical protein